MPHPAAIITDPDSITGQLAALGLLPEGWDRPEGGDAGTTIDLSNSTAVTVPRRPRRPRLVRPQRTRDPMLIGWPSESGRQLECWCPFCCNWHYHGRHGGRCGADCACEIHAHPGTMRRYPCACPPGSGDGHRSAHCPPGSPFRLIGNYHVREVRP